MSAILFFRFTRNEIIRANNLMCNFPNHLKVGDFVNFTDNFPDIFFEIKSIIYPCENSDYWGITFYTYSKYGDRAFTRYHGSGRGDIRRVIPAEMAIPIMCKLYLRWHAKIGKYDPLTGFVRAGNLK